MSDLLPCPFCGNAAKVLEKYYRTAVKKRSKLIVCDTCLSSSLTVKMWNTRAASPSEWQREALDLIQETIGSTVGPQDQSGICLIHINQLERLSAFYARLEAVHDLMRRAPPPNNHNREGA